MGGRAQVKYKHYMLLRNEHPWILVSAGCHGTNSLWAPKDDRTVPEPT